ncbi:hypothetical protein K1T71_014628 [Dendrolimus kikuchii]|uniref:Uncharacterized protein n=1 Tax=Dendrolimus kikuchii TaxID=765133 RepID=A0ACC1CEU1_9NEOP|nr:hypothetical protein K1T71_014628 [Dendrolimus kikuchii]
MYRNKLYLYGDDDLEVPVSMNLAHEMFKKILSYKDNVAILNAETKEQVTYSELAQRIANVAIALTRMGVGKGDVISICSEKSMQFLPTLLGIICTGATFAAADITCGSATVLHRVNIVKPRFILCSELAYTRHGKQFGDKCIRLSEMEFKDVPLDQFQAVPVEGFKDNVIIFFSSGTTGLPKGIPTTHLSLLIGFLGAIKANNYYLGRSVLCTREWYYSYGCMHTLICVFAGATIVYCPSDTEEEYIKAIQDLEISVLQLVPSTVARLVKSSLLEKYNVSSVKYVNSASTPLDADLMKVFKQKFTGIVDIYQFYGMSEVGFVTSDAHATKGTKLGSAGVAAASVIIKVVDMTSREPLGPHQRGEICMKSPTVTKGYLNVSSDGVFDEEGFLKTGDIGYYDEDGYFFIVERMKDLIKFNSYQVAPAELEAVLLQHPSVKDAAVVGVPHVEWGEVPTGLVVRQPGATTEAAEIVEFVNSQVSHRMCLAGGLKFVDALPYGGGGKLDRKVLKQLL